MIDLTSQVSEILSSLPEDQRETWRSRILSGQLTRLSQPAHSEKTAPPGFTRPAEAFSHGPNARPVASSLWEQYQNELSRIPEGAGRQEAVLQLRRKFRALGLEL